MGRRLDVRYDNAVDLYSRGMSVGDCAEFYGITRQAMHTILQRRGAVFRDQLKFGDDNHFHRGDGVTSIKIKAQHIIANEVKRGRLIPEPCEQCGDEGEMSDGRNKVQAHHDDYGKPLDIRWLCQSCHHEWHKTNKAKGGSHGTLPQAIDVVCGGYP